VTLTLKVNVRVFAFAVRSGENAAMRDDNLERWQKLCQEAAGELDHDRLLKLIQEINQMLSEKEERFKAARSVREPHDQSAA